MTLRDLLGEGPSGVQITGLAFDNRAVEPGFLFFCVPGFTRDGHDFAPDAVQRGAAALVVARPLGLGREEAARGMLAILDNNMMGALRIVSVERGHDPRDFTLVPFGGAGPLHGCALAELLGIRRVLVTQDGRLKGIVSRADLLRALVAPVAEQGELSDDRIRRAVMAAMKKAPNSAGTAMPAIAWDMASTQRGFRTAIGTRFRTHQ